MIILSWELSGVQVVQLDYNKPETLAVFKGVEKLFLPVSIFTNIIISC